MTDRPYRQVQWLISDYDFTVHAFYHESRDAPGHLEALCTHSVPPEKITRPEDTTLQPSHCQTCLQMYGEMVTSRVQQQWHD